MEERYFETDIAWFNHKIDFYLSNQQRNPFAKGHLNVRRLMVMRKKLIEGRKTDMGIKMFIKQHRIT